MIITSLMLAVLAQTPAPAAAPAPSPAASTAAEAGPALPPNVVHVADKGWMPLFNGENLDGWYTFRQRDGKNNDVQHVFKVENGMVHVLDVPDPATAQPNGYMATNEEFRNYRVRLEYKWGIVKFAVPRHPDGLPRDGGLLYHMTGADQVWPMCVEFQIEEHDTGDVWLLPNSPPNPSADSTVSANADGTPLQKQRNMFVYAEGGVPATDRGQRLYHSAQFDTMDNWNTVELFTAENSAVHVVNGHVNNYVYNLQLPNNGGPMVQGKILLQEENNELFYRKVEIKPRFTDRFGGPPYKVLAFGSPAAANAAAAIKLLGQQNNFTADPATDPVVFTDANLKQYKVVIVLDAGVSALNAAQQQAFQRFIEAGGGYVGVSAAAAPLPNWAWYGKLAGASLGKAPSALVAATLKLDNPYHAATSSLPLNWAHVDSWPNFQASPRAAVQVLASVDESTYAGGTMGADHPVAWCQDYDGGRAFYTALGAAPEDYKDPLFLIHLLGGIMYAAATDGTAPPGATVLFNGKDVSQWVGKDNATFPWNFHDGVIEPFPATYPNGVRVMVGDIHSKETYTDFQLHVEFKVPGTKNPNTRDANSNEQARGNSGVYLQGRYECQILDTYDHPMQDMNDEGAVYGIKDPLVNAALPAELWQSYDITFHAARWQDGKKIANARVTSYLNGVLVQDNTEIPKATQSSQLPDGPEPGPIGLQDHLNPVQFLYVWVRPLTEAK